MQCLLMKVSSGYNPKNEDFKMNKYGTDSMAAILYMLQIDTNINVSVKTVPCNVVCIPIGLVLISCHYVFIVLTHLTRSKIIGIRLYFSILYRCVILSNNL